MDFTQTKKYWRTPTAKIATILDVKKTDYKGKESAVVVLQNEEGELIDAKFQLPMNDITKKLWAKLCQAAHVDPKNGSELKGKKIGIQIGVSVYNNKKYYNPSGYCDASLLVSEEEGINNDGFGEEDTIGF